MKTRSQTKAEAEFVRGAVESSVEPVVRKRQIYEVDIDFDGASEAWHMNKKRLPNGCYEYVCEAITKTGRKCCRKARFASEYCLVHSKKNNK